MRSGILVEEKAPPASAGHSDDGHLALEMSCRQLDSYPQLCILNSAHKKERVNGLEPSTFSLEG
jgi:hypothetical protein